MNMLFVYLLLCSCIHLSNCISGWINPPVLYVERGEKVTFVCGVEGLSESSNPSANLSFYNQTSGQTIDSSYVRILNKTAVELTLPKVPEQRTTIYCQYNGVQGVTTAELNVGRKPDIIPKLDCYSYHWASLNCSFIMPENHVPVHYELKYSQVEKKHINNAMQVYDCESITKLDNLFMCRFSEAKYRRTGRFFTFNLTAKNILGTTTEFYEFDNFAHIIVDVPSEWKHDEPTDKSVRVKWELPKGKLRALDKPFDFEISVECHCYQDENKSKIISLKNMSADSSKNFSHVIELEYAYTWYDIKIRSKISMGENIEKMWSPWSEALQVKSKPRLPDFPPEINHGAFNILPNDDVYVYWKDIPQCSHNGDNFTYSVDASGYNGGSPTELKDTFAVYRKNKNLADHGATVSIKSLNSVGLSALPSELKIPSKDLRIKGPKNLQKRLKNGTYIITWSPPENVTDIESYTVFWCTSKTEGENKCNDKSFNFHRIAANEVPTFQHKSDDTVNFAVSVNTRDSTSGMTWTTCTTGNSNEIGKIKSIWIPRLSSYEIDIKWRLECTDMGIVTGYVIEYCPAIASKTFACLNDQEMKKLEIKENLEHTEYTLTGLDPYTTYGIYISMSSNSTVGPRSDPLVNTTFQAAPSPVRELLVRKVENTSVLLIWDPPERFNGPLGEYVVSIDTEEVTIAVDKSNATDTVRYHWKGLEPYRFYNAAVRACTNLCSSNWTQSSFTTAMGAPGQIKEHPTVETKTRAHIFSQGNVSSVLKWSEPEYKGGRMDFYELKIDFMPKDGKTSKQSSIHRFKSKECILDKMCNTNESGSYTFQVRGVNFFLSPHRSEEASKIDVHSLIRGSEELEVFCDLDDKILIDSLNYIKKFDNHSQFFYGKWSPQHGHTCSIGNNDSQDILLYMFVTVVTIVFIATIFYLYRKIRDIKNIIAEFPPGLEELSGDKGKKGKPNPLEKPDLLHNVDNASILNEDEHKRLLRRSINGSIGGDCSSSMHSENTRSELDQNDMGDEIEYNDFGSKHYELSENDNANGRFQAFLLNPTTGEEVKPILVPPEPMPTSTPRESPKPHIIMNPSDVPTTLSSAYMPAPPPPSIQVNSNGYVTPAMFTPMSSQPSSGYTQLNGFGKPILNNDRIPSGKMNLKTPMVATTDQNGISGYVTHKQLSDFGHRMQ